MPFLRNKAGGNIGVLISTVLLCCFIAINNLNDPMSIFTLISAIFVILCGMCILLWWRSRLQKAYIEKLRADEMQSLREAVQEKEQQIKRLEQNNDSLAEIIHKDNKLIPAMELAVREYLQSFERESRADIQLKGQMLLKQLKEIFCDRSGIIEDYQSTNEIMPQTGVFPIDALMEYMFNKAKANGIKYEFTVSGSVRYMVENIISVSDLRTLLADLIENAIIATKSCDKKKILVSLGVYEGYYMVDVFDSGKPFEQESLINFGRKKTTTHANTGGSGIGLITVSEILNNYHASFIIEEFPDKYNIYTKKVSVIFDHLNQYMVKARTDEEIRTISVREDSIVII
jgi:signal transduction histidine kinase